MIGRLVRDRRGATLVEFALVAPVLFLLLLGAFDLCHHAYAQAILSGAIHEAGRKGTLEGNDTQAIADATDAAVVSQVRQVARDLRWKSDRKHYRNFQALAAEPYDDANHNDMHDSGECFTDINGNRMWDADPGKQGQGGANDVTLYTMTITYPRMFPFGALLGLPPEQVISARTMLKNQPYGSQSAEAPETIC